MSVGWGPESAFSQSAQPATVGASGPRGQPGTSSSSVGSTGEAFHDFGSRIPDSLTVEPNRLTPLLRRHGAAPYRDRHRRSTVLTSVWTCGPRRRTQFAQLDQGREEAGSTARSDQA